MRPIVVVALILTWAFAPVACAWTLPDSTVALVEAYRSELARVRSATARSSLEPLYERARHLSDALLMPDPAESGPPLVALSDEEYERLKQVVSEFDFDRGIYEMAEPRPEFFDSLAIAIGLPADTAFWRRFRDLAGGSFPIYEQQETDYSSCTEFGTGVLVAAYESWSNYRRRYPNHYVEPVSKQAEMAASTLTEEACACGDRASVERELALFLATHARDPLATRVRARLAAVRSGRAKMRYNCSPG